MSILQELRAAERWPSFFTGHSGLDFKNEPMRVRMPRRKPAIRPWRLACPKSRSNGKFALKAAIKEFGIINPEHQNRLFVRQVPSDDN